MGATVSYSLVVAFWLVGAAAMGVFAWRGGQDGARRPLESLVHSPALAVAPVAGR
jgi:hypothetical protein